MIISVFCIFTSLHFHVRTHTHECIHARIRTQPNVCHAQSDGSELCMNVESQQEYLNISELSMHHGQWIVLVNIMPGIWCKLWLSKNAFGSCIHDYLIFHVKL